MITPLSLTFLLGSIPDLLLCNTIGFQPIDISINEHFGNVLMPQETPKAPLVSSSFVHQGANFFFNPHLFMSSDGFPERMEAVLTDIKNCNATSSVTTPEITIGHEKSTAKPTQLNSTEISKYTEAESTTDDLPTTTLEPETIIVEELLELPPPPQPIIIDNYETSVTIQQPVVIPDAPTLPPLSDFTLPEVIEEIEKPVDVITDTPLDISEVPALEDETIEVLPSVPPAPQLPPLELPEFPPPIIIDQALKPKPCVQEIITINEDIAPIVIPKPQKLLGILTSIPVVSHVPVIIPVKEKCEPCLNIDTPILENNISDQGLPLILPNNGISSKTVVFLPTASELPLTPKLPIDFLIGEKFKERSQLVYPTACAHNIVMERIVPNIMFSEKSPKNFKIISVPAAALK